MLAELTGVPVPRWRVPYSVGIAVAWFSELFADRWTGRAPKATVTGVRLAKRTMHFDSSRSLAELGLQPRPIHESLADALTWFDNFRPCFASRCRLESVERKHEGHVETLGRSNRLTGVLRTESV